MDSGGRKSSVDESGESTVSLGMKAKAYASKRSNINARYDFRCYTVCGARLRKMFCNMFSGSSPCLLGQHGICSSAQLPVELSEDMLQNIFLTLPPQTVSSELINT